MCLGYEEPVEGVTVMARERRAAHDLAVSDFQLFKSVEGHLIGQVAVGNSGHAEFIEADFDRDFPKAREADEAVFGGDYLASFL